jgi:hypothetical protein
MQQSTRSSVRGRLGRLARLTALLALLAAVLAMPWGAAAAGWEARDPTAPVLALCSAPACERP